MRDLHQELERAVQLSEMFVSILGHDLRTPLAAMLMTTDGLLRRGLDQPLRNALQRVYSTGDRMARMIEQLLDFARSRGHGGLLVQPQHANLEEIVRPVVEEIEVASPLARIELTTKGDLSGTWDVDQLGRVVSNLAGNAVKHGTQGEPVSLELEGTHAASVRLRVTNSGAIPPDMIPTLFEPFKRTAPARTGEKGLGLGLFIGREIVQAHGGTIDVHTGGDDRTVFEVSLPRHAAMRDARGPS
jgi:signal transduction histidine kinase